MRGDMEECSKHEVCLVRNYAFSMTCCMYMYMYVVCTYVVCTYVVCTYVVCTYVYVVCCV